jgi:hypothetical protein
MLAIPRSACTGSAVREVGQKHRKAVANTLHGRFRTQIAERPGAENIGSVSVLGIAFGEICFQLPSRFVGR